MQHSLPGFLCIESRKKTPGFRGMELTESLKKCQRVQQKSIFRLGSLHENGYKCPQGTEMDSSGRVLESSYHDGTK